MRCHVESAPKCYDMEKENQQADVMFGIIPNRGITHSHHLALCTSCFIIIWPSGSTVAYIKVIFKTNFQYGLPKQSTCQRETQSFCSIMWHQDDIKEPASKLSPWQIRWGFDTFLKARRKGGGLLNLLRQGIPCPFHCHRKDPVQEAHWTSLAQRQARIRAYLEDVGVKKGCYGRQRPLRSKLEG